MTVTLESLPVELIADILGELDLDSLITLSCLSRLLRNIASDSSLNPWRRPILRALTSGQYEDSLRHLSVRRTVPRLNWVEILTLAHPSFILLDATLPNLKATEWEECFHRRFLPGWRKWKKDGTWKAAYLTMLYRVCHRSVTSCTAEEAWTKYIVLNRNGSANELEITSRNFNPLALFNQIKLQNNLAHLETRVQVVVRFADVRILAFGTLNRPSTLTANPNAHIFLHPPGVDANGIHTPHCTPKLSEVVEDHGVYPVHDKSWFPPYQSYAPSMTYTRLTHPLPSPSHANYPFYTPGGGDGRRRGSEEVDESGLRWVGGLMIVAQLIGQHTLDLSSDRLPLQELDLVIGSGRQQYCSFTWRDLWTIAPWLEERITMKIDGPGLGI